MSRADDVRARYEAELAVIELEEELVAAKDANDGEAPRELKERLREARRVFREQRAGEATVSPETVEASASVQESGGGS